MAQLKLFDQEKKEEKEHPPSSQIFDSDKLLEFLQEMNRRVEEDNKMLQAILDDLQKGWSEDDKLQINNPKEWQRQQELKSKENKPEEPMKQLTAEAIDTLKNSKVEGLIVKLPEGQLDRKIYQEVKNKLELIGGKWKGGKIGGFVFLEDPSELLEEIANGGNRNLKKEFQFFATPDKLADKLVELAEVKEGERVLEPSAGQGAIIKAINRAVPGLMVECFEAMPINQIILKKVDTAVFIGEDFLKANEPEGFDKIVANPPFAKNQDIDHIRKMYELLKSGGRIVSIASIHWKLSDNRKETDFRDWLFDLGAEIIDIDAGEFKESGTMVSTCILVIDKF